MSFFALSALFNCVTSVFLGFFVFLKSRRSAVNRSYALLSLSITFWSGAYFLWQTAQNPTRALLYVRLLSIGSVFIPSMFLYFILSFLHKQKNYQKLIASSLGLSVCFTLFSFTRAFIPMIEPKLGFRFWPVAGFLYSVFLCFFFACISFAVYLLARASRDKTQSEYRLRQIRYVLMASLVGFIGGSTNYPLWYNVLIPPVLNFFVGLHVLILAYAIIKYRLLDIRVAITRTMIFVTVYAFVLGIPFILATSGKAWLIKTYGVLWWLSPLVLMAFLGTTGPFVYLFLKNRAEAILLRKQRKYQAALKQASVDLTRIRNLQNLLDFIARTLSDSVQITHTAIYFFDAKKNEFILQSGVNLPPKQPQSIAIDSPLVSYLNQSHDALVLNEFKRIEEESGNKSYRKLENVLNGLSADMVIPCFLENKLLDIFILGEKISGQIYSQEDIDHFLVLAQETALATENAQLYEKIENEVKERTQELVETQKQLVHAEKLATVGTLAGGVAHEINNPLAAIMTNVQMLLAGDELDRESLEMIEEATKRCKTIVQKLMTFSQKPMANTMMYQIDLLDVIRHTVDFLKFQLEQENITLEVKADKKSYPARANHDELGQVVTNIVLNAKDAIKQIKKSGTVYITISENETQTMISIKDEGTGIPKTILNRIFDPFYTTKEVGKGLGLGLSISQTIIEKHKGKILVESQVDKGSTFIIQLPKFKQQSKNSEALK